MKARKGRRTRPRRYKMRCFNETGPMKARKALIDKAELLSGGALQ